MGRWVGGWVGGWVEVRRSSTGRCSLLQLFFEVARPCSQKEPIGQRKEGRFQAPLDSNGAQKISKCIYVCRDLFLPIPFKSSATVKQRHGRGTEEVEPLVNGLAANRRGPDGYCKHGRA